eukprot:Pompholyxophrys_punicea_v1_NODE_135_length_3273_cov_11.162523.p4 type:complete len:151 gc:universal NODE_135_length_3273_cov_11.162523:1804-2256(+)
MEFIWWQMQPIFITLKVSITKSLGNSGHLQNICRLYFQAADASTLLVHFMPTVKTTTLQCWRRSFKELFLPQWLSHTSAEAHEMADSRTAEEVPSDDEVEDMPLSEEDLKNDTEWQEFSEWVRKCPKKNYFYRGQDSVMCYLTLKALEWK